MSYYRMIIIANNGCLMASYTSNNVSDDRADAFAMCLYNM